MSTISLENCLLGTNDGLKLRQLLLQDPASHLYLLGILSDWGVVAKPAHPPFKFYGNHNGQGLDAAIFLGGEGGLVIPCSGNPSKAVSLGQAVSQKHPAPLQSCLGERTAVEGLLASFNVPRPRISRPQTLFCVSADDLGPFTNPTLRLATEADALSVLALAAGHDAERYVGLPQRETKTLQSKVLNKIRNRRTYVLEIDRKLVFKVDVGSRSAFGAELEGLYTVPAERRKGHAILSLGQISRHLLGALPRLALRIDDDDYIMPNLARRVGYLAGKKQRLVIV